MELILLILKIILMAFLLVLGLVVLALAIILFVPIRYEVSGSIGDSWEFQVKGKVSYLLSIIKLWFSYENDQFDIKLFLFGFEKKLQQEDTDETVNETTDETVDDGSDATEDEVVGTSGEAEEAEITIQEKKNSSVSEQQGAKAEESVEKPSHKVKRKKEKNSSKFDFAFIKQQLTDEHNKSVVRKIWSEICYLLKHFKFRKIVTDLVFATGDPATTGQALGILCMIPMLYRYEFKLVPDFEAEDAYIKGTFLVAGKVRLIHLVVTILRLIFDKEVRLVIKRILALLEK